MPIRSEIEHLKIPHALDRRVRLTPEQRQEIREAKGASLSTLATQYGVSKRLIQFIRDPEKHARNIEARQARGGSAQYYDRDTQRSAVAATRAYRKSIESELGATK